MKAQNISKCSRLLQTNKLVITLQKHGSKEDPAFFCNKLSVSSYTSPKCWSHFLCDWVRPAPSDLIFGLLCSFYLRVCRDQATCAQPEALGRTNKHSATKKSSQIVLTFNRAFVKILRQITLALLLSMAFWNRWLFQLQASLVPR